MQANKHRWYWYDWHWFSLCFASLSFLVISFFPPQTPFLPICSLLHLASFGLYISLSWTVSLHLSSSLLKKIERETWRESGISLIATVTRLMERLLDYRWECTNTLRNTHSYMVYPLWSCHMSSALCVYHRDCMKLGEVDGKKIGCTVSLLVSSSYSL